MPIIQLSFPNPLNTSVQVGDNAYFSNPTPVSATGNPLGGQWESTVTPHMTNDIDGIIDLGEITTITPWDGTNSFITCDMDQVLFNKYFSSISAGGCSLQVTFDPNHCTGMCCSINRLVNEPVNASIVSYLINNPTALNTDTAGHLASPFTVYTDSNGNFTSVQIGNYGTNNPTTYADLCSVVLGEKDVNGIDDYNPDPSVLNIWWYMGFILSGAPVGGWNYLAPHSWNDVLTFLISLYPNDYSMGMNYPQVNSARSDIDLSVDINPVQGSSGLTSREVCAQGSYIMFSKDNKANLSSMLGYYASVEYRNSSQIKSELYNVGTDFFESSK